MTDPLDLVICATCGTQYSTLTPPPTCTICDDPRQYVPPTGQTWTTLRTLQTSTPTPNTPNNNSTTTSSSTPPKPKYTNILTPLPHAPEILTIHTTPKLAIGQRAFLLCTPHGNILWDCLTYLDDRTIAHIHSLGGISAIIISHPHYYTTHLVWAEAFQCPVYLSVEDREWVMRVDTDDKGEGSARQVFWEGKEMEVIKGSGVWGIKTGGHFPGSSVVWWPGEGMKGALLLADTIGTVPSGMGDYGEGGGKGWDVDSEMGMGRITYTFMWSFPNMIPLPPDDVHNIWKALKHTEFDQAYGAFMGMDTAGKCKQRLLDSAKIFVKAMGYLDHAIHAEECP
ncbi:putative metallo-beta-lactamase domain protein [Aspergillus ibericus CBS 121593]|uniref:Metallo-beta-lactamase domain-containing protein n=1 Tax=Aspergillus ibericus CBS 121593 TaxID=1448316 RepID=A0A395GZY6_9EURO|nr:hypothetical protein BO80DRAFT_445020 [Aspergillus ibericus CBS 121593]RAL01161.1 hypothetical protein BO80DRAFT_445020 [Aspergillus ibericus CBS 121593]